MHMNFQDKQVVVTGGANGIGFAIAKGFAASGASVWILDLPSSNLTEIAGSIGAQAIEANVADQSSLQQAFDQIPAPNIVCVNAGINKLSPLLEVERADWDRILSVNLSGAFNTIQIAAKKMRTTGGSIVITASTNSYDGEPDLIAYNATKAGVLGLLHTAANELGPYGIRVNAVCPGLIRTRLNSESFSNPKLLANYFQHVALGRGGEPEEVAQAIMFLGSDLASYITGATLLVDGGQMASKFGTWGQQGDTFDGQRWRRSG